MEFYQGQYIIAIDEKEIENYKKNRSKLKSGNRIEAKYIKWQPKDWSKRGRWWKSRKSAEKLAKITACSVSYISRAPNWD